MVLSLVHGTKSEIATNIHCFFFPHTESGIKAQKWGGIAHNYTANSRQFAFHLSELGLVIRIFRTQWRNVIPREDISDSNEIGDCSEMEGPSCQWQRGKWKLHCGLRRFNLTIKRRQCGATRGRQKRA